MDIKTNKTNEQLINIYRSFCVKIGKMASKEDLDNSNEIYNSNVFIEKFGGMAKLKKTAGFETRKEFIQYSRETIKNKLLIKYKKNNNKILTNEQILEDKELPSLDIILKYFKATKIGFVWSKVLI